MAQQDIDPEAVIAGLTTQIGQLTTQVIMRDVALAAAHRELDELKAAAEVPIGTRQRAAAEKVDTVFEKAPR